MTDTTPSMSERPLSLSPLSLSPLTDALVRLGDLALALGRIDRTACYHPDRQRKENVAEHTVMLGWIAPALAHQLFPKLNHGLIAQFCLVHDAVEVYAGDTQTLRITAEEQQGKAAREEAATARIREEFLATLPWFTGLIEHYEAQRLPEARFVRALDKLLPKIVHLLDGCHGLHEFGITRAELTDTLAQQDRDMRAYAGEFDALFEIRHELVSAVLGHPSWDAAAHE